MTFSAQIFHREQVDRRYLRGARDAATNRVTGLSQRSKRRLESAVSSYGHVPLQFRVQPEPQAQLQEVRVHPAGAEQPQ